MRKTKLNEKDQKIMDAMSEKSDEDGGFTVPQDIQTDIHELRRTDDDLEQYQTQEDKVTTQTATLKGSFYERACDGNFETQVDESNLLAEHTDAAAAIKNWFGKVQEPTEAA